MQPQGTSVFNAAYLQNITLQIQGIANNINTIDPCAQIQAIVDEVMAEAQVEINAIESQISSLNVLITLPTNLGEVITWIGKFMAPNVQAVLNYISQLEQMVAAIAKLVAAVEEAASRIANCSISITPPTVSVPLPSVTIV